MRTIVWFRGKDLRVADHAPLADAAEAGEVIPLFVVDPFFFAPARAAQLPHRMQFLTESIAALAAGLKARGSRLVLVAGKSVEVVPTLVKQWRADRVVAHRWVEPFARERDRRLQQALGEQFVLYEGETLLPPGTLRTQAGTPYAVFTQFSNQFHRAAHVGKPIAAPARLPPVPRGIVSTAPLPGWKPRNAGLLPGGEPAALKRLKRFAASGAKRYAARRDRMDLDGTSRLSADLKFGTLSVRQVWHAVKDPTFLNELVWREFTHSTLWDRPQLLTTPFRPGFVGFPWRDDPRGWAAWVGGKTGYPVVDAAARQLLGEGFVHNRARMITASFLTKHLLIDFRRGEAHFMKYLTDGDWAQNDAGWQWSAGCGCDAQPYFRIFNPVAQGQRFDPAGDYVRRWVPELKAVPTEWIHAPWEAPPDVRARAGAYPPPIVEHRFARERFLATARRHLKGPPGR